MRGATLTGRLPADLANKVSAAIAAATARGAATDEACCVAAQVIADYWRSKYGNGTLGTLCEVVLKRSETPLPDAGPEYMPFSTRIDPGETVPAAGLQ